MGQEYMGGLAPAEEDGWRFDIIDI